VRAWHWMREDGSLGWGDPRVPRDGEVLRHEGKLELCSRGLHASRSPLDALQWAPGSMICRVECGGTILHGDDKLVCSERTILWRANATDVLQRFSRLCALDVAHLWEMSEVVRRYLRTGDESLRAAARDAARDAARAAAEDAAWYAARDAARAAARAAARDAAWIAAEDTARDAARAAARAAAEDAAWYAARDAARAAAWYAARDAAWIAAWIAARAAARDAAWYAARDAQSKRLHRMLRDIWRARRGEGVS
jgi:hypothetical protein